MNVKENSVSRIRWIASQQRYAKEERPSLAS